MAGADLTVLRSGRRNQQTTPIGTVTTLASPITAGRQLAFERVLNAGAVEFEERWDGFCECGGDPAGDERDPRLEGVLGNWRAQRSHLYLTERTQSDLNRNTYIREDGTFRDFRPFWTPDGGDDWIANPDPWQFTSEVTLFSPFGFELENRDALGRHSAALYGFNNTLPTAVASNSRYREIAFESFEDLACDACESDHLSFTGCVDDLEDDYSHSGRYSLRVGANSRVSVVRKIACEPAVVPPLTLEADGSVRVDCDRFSGNRSEVLLKVSGASGPTPSSTTPG